MPSRYSPRDEFPYPPLSNVINVDTAERNQCAGIAVSTRRRCRHGLGAGRSSAIRLLNYGTREFRAGESVSDVLEDLAPLVLCHDHKCQASALIWRWENELAEFYYAELAVLKLVRKLGAAARMGGRPSTQVSSRTTTSRLRMGTSGVKQTTYSKAVQRAMDPTPGKAKRDFSTAGNLQLQKPQQRVSIFDKSHTNTTNTSPAPRVNNNNKTFHQAPSQSVAPEVPIQGTVDGESSIAQEQPLRLEFRPNNASLTNLEQGKENEKGHIGEAKEEGQLPREIDQGLIRSKTRQGTSAPNFFIDWVFKAFHRSLPVQILAVLGQGDSKWLVVLALIVILSL